MTVVLKAQTDLHLYVFGDSKYVKKIFAKIQTMPPSLNSPGFDHKKLRLVGDFPDLGQCYKIPLVL